MRRVTWIVVAVLGGFLALYKGAACVRPQGCTEIGCADEVSIALAFADKRWPEGAYELEVVLDDVKHVCSFRWPEAQPAHGSVRPVPCEPRALHADLSQEAVCTEQRTDDAVSQSCAPLDGQYSLRLNTSGTPKRLQLRATRDGELLTNQALDLVYTESQPNGPDCGPVCRQSRRELQLD